MSMQERLNILNFNEYIDLLIDAIFLNKKNSLLYYTSKFMKQ